MNRKLTVIVAVVALAIVLLVGYNVLLAPKGVEGAKEVTIDIVNEDTDLDESYTYNTDHEFLFELMKEHEDELGLEYDDSEFGAMVTGLGGYAADDSEQEYYHISVNGVDATTGVSEIVLNDGDNYKFEIMNY